MVLAEMQSFYAQMKSSNCERSLRIEMGVNRMTGTSWNAERVHRSEGDKRRYKGRCKYQNNKKRKKSNDDDVYWY